MSKPRELPQPVRHNPDRWVENTYQNAQGNPDVRSQAGQERYLEERMTGNQHVGPEGEWRRVTTTESTTSFRHRGWYIRPRTAVASFLAFNAIGNIYHNYDYLKEKVSDLLKGDDKQTAQVAPEPQREKKVISRTLRHEPGSIVSVTDKQTIASMVAEYLDARDQGFVPDGALVAGESSDEWVARGPSSIGSRDQGNAKYAADRTAGVERTLENEAASVGAVLPEVRTISGENILEGPDITALNDTLTVNGFGPIDSSFKDLLTQYKSNPDQLPPDVRDSLDRYLRDSRGVLAAISMHRDIIPVTPAPTPEKEFDPNFYWFVPPIPRLRRERAVKTSTAWENIAADLPNPVWVKLYPEAIDPQTPDQLNDHAWAYTRIYQILMREGRINTVMTHSYQDDNGKDQNLRVMFVDHEPTDRTTAFVQGFLEDLSMMRGGTVPDKLSTIAVFPRETAGKSAKEVGLGVDEQEPRNVLGLAIPLLNLVELHIPEDPAPEDIDGLMQAKWVFAHEVAGHFTDLKDGKIPVRVVDRARKEYVTINPFEGVAADMQADHPPLAEVTPEDQKYHITRQLVDRDGEPVVRVDRVDGTDPRLGEAQAAVLVNASPTRYAGITEYELYAETAAQVYTKTEIPFSQAGVAVESDEALSFAEGYSASHDLKDMFTERIGTTLEDPQGALWDIPAWEERQRTATFTTTSMAEDPLLAELATYARTRELPSEAQLIKILTSVLNTQK